MSWLLLGCNVAETTPTAIPLPPTTTLPTTTLPTATLPTATRIPPTLVATETAVPLRPFYYLLSERTAELIEVDPAAPRPLRRFALPIANGGNAGPEGLTFIPNSAITTHGLFGLEPSAHGGYFLVSTQADGTIYVVEVPLLAAEGETAVIHHRFTIPDLDEDASALDYQEGTLWVAMAKKERLYAVSLNNDGATVNNRYDLNDLPEKAKDTEGIVFPAPSWQPNAIFLADDNGQTLHFYLDFPACLEPKLCEPFWSKPVGPLEPSGLAWDATQQLLVMVDDGGQLWQFDIDAQTEKRVLQVPDDLEGVAVVVR